MGKNHDICIKVSETNTEFSWKSIYPIFQQMCAGKKKKCQLVAEKNCKIWQANAKISMKWSMKKKICIF